jgi:phosphoglycerate dehydrogenase-like enzyme
MARRSGGAVARHHSSDGRLPDTPSPPGAGCGRVATVPGPVPIAVAPDTRPDMYDAFAAAVRAGGGRLANVEDARALVWADPARADAFPLIARTAGHLEWIQLPYAGIEPFAAYLDPRYVWTCGKGVYARPVAEHALGLALAGLRGLDVYSRAQSWGAPTGRNLIGAHVTIVGGGGICEHLMNLLVPFGCSTTVVRRHPAEMRGATVVGTDGLHEAVSGADVVVLALALTAESVGMIDEGVLAAMPAHSWLVNVARGGHVVTDHLVRALREHQIGGAALDVTDPEPLPDGHPLWHIPNCIITPHIANTPEMGLPLIAARVRANVARFVAGEPLIGLVDVAAGY